MNTDRVYQNLVQKMHQVSDIPPQTMGPLTPVYRAIIPYVKEAPWRWFALGSIVTVVAFYFIFGALIVRFVSILQWGF